MVRVRPEQQQGVLVLGLEPVWQLVRQLAWELEPAPEPEELGALVI